MKKIQSSRFFRRLLSIKGAVAVAFFLLPPWFYAITSLYRLHISTMTNEMKRIDSSFFLVKPNKSSMTAIKTIENNTANISSISIVIRNESLKNYSEHYHDHFPVVDIMSFGTQSRLDLLKTQKKTWGSHSMFRNYYSVTELDDANPRCIESGKDIHKLTKRCRKKKVKGLWPRYQFMPAILTLGKGKINPIGWHCGHARPGTGIGVLGRRYRQNTTSLPDFVLFVDDDNMYNPYFLSKRLEKEDPSVPKVWGGCLKIDFLDSPHRFWLYGGGGSIWSRASIERAIQPIHCQMKNKTGGTTTIHQSKQEQDTFEEHVCYQLNHSGDLLQEAKYWREGMSISDLMYAFANRNGCIYSDYMQSFFVNYYHLSSIWNGSVISIDDDESRIHPYESVMYGFEPTIGTARVQGQACQDVTSNKQCSGSSTICHGIHEGSNMESLWNRYKDQWMHNNS
mmetsp:Transcript_13207/g.20515  ORF Transcript_13207/g.20515 Transcript_13207/m.20515 type:complete len:452 (+) Transcript_13207:220-1575(+)